MEGETVLLDLKHRALLHLEPVGQRHIWEHCIGHSTISDIHAVLCDRMDVALEQALDDLVTLINQLVQEGYFIKK